MTNMLLVFWYLYVVVDGWSRKFIAWQVSRSLAHAEALGLLDDGIIGECLLEVPEDERPVVVNDHGGQMKAKPVQQMLIDLGIEQSFARRRTPNDDPYVESLFSTIKASPVYPGWFPYDDEITDCGMNIGIGDWRLVGQERENKKAVKRSF